MSGDLIAFLIGIFITSITMFYVRHSGNKQINKEIEELNDKKRQDTEAINKLSDDLRRDIGKFRKLRANKRRPKK